MDQNWKAIYRPRPYFLIAGILCTIAFLIMGAGMTFVSYFNIDGSFTHPKTAALATALFYSGWTALGIYLIVFSFKYRLSIGNGQLRQTGVFTDRLIDLETLRSAKWRIGPTHGSIRLIAADSKLTVELGMVLPEYKQVLIDYLRTSIPLDRQNKWEKFNGYYHPEDAREKETNNQKPLAWLGGILILFGLSFVVTWLMGAGTKNLVLAGINFALGGWLIMRSRKNLSNPNQSTQGERDVV